MTCSETLDTLIETLASEESKGLPLSELGELATSQALRRWARNVTPAFWLGFARWDGDSVVVGGQAVITTWPQLLREIGAGDGPSLRAVLAAHIRAGLDWFEHSYEGDDRAERIAELQDVASRYGITL